MDRREGLRRAREALWKKRALPAVAVQVVVPQAAQDLLFRPFELARFADGTSFGKAGVRFVYGLEGATAAAVAKEPVEKALRILAAFSLPVRANPLNLRRERYGLQRLARDLNQTQNLAVELRVLQYGATRETLQEAMEEAEGWDIIHLSGHGQQGELLLEDDRGGSDTINAEELGELLDLARARLKLLILDACYSGVGSQAAAREQVGLERAAVRQEGVEGAALAQTAGTALPGLAQALSQRLDCAALAMRYPVGDAFATELMLALYEKLLDKRRPLPAVLHLALEDTLEADIPKPPLSPATPILVGVRGAELQLAPPPQEAQTIALPTVGLSIAFPPEPTRFVGRLQPMLRASQALARRGPKRGVLFHGMPGAGKTACALELTYRHEQGRFQGYVWHRGPEAGSDIASALFNLMQDIQTQLNAPTLGLTTALDDPQHFRQYTLPRLRALLKQKSLLLVLDNLETLLTDSDGWRDPLWGEVVAALLAHDGPSRVVLTSRRMPAGLANQPKVQVEPIHALSFAESVLLARELPNLKRLFDDEAGRKLVQQTLRRGAGAPQAPGAGGRPGRRPAGAGGAGGHGGGRAGGPGRCAGHLLRRGRGARGRDAAAGRRLRAGAAGVDGRGRRHPDTHGPATLRLPLPPGTGRSAAGHPGGHLGGLPDAAGGGARRRRGGAGRAGPGSARGAGETDSRGPSGCGAADSGPGANREPESDAGRPCRAGQSRPGGAAGATGRLRGPGDDLHHSPRRGRDGASGGRPGRARRGRHRAVELLHRRVPAGPEKRDRGRRQRSGRECPPRRALPAASGTLGRGGRPAGTDARSGLGPDQPGLRSAAAAPHRRGHHRHQGGVDHRRHPGQDADAGRTHHRGGADVARCDRT